MQHLKALAFLYAFEETVDCHLLSSFCDDSNLHISLFKYVLSTMGVSKESISKFLIAIRFYLNKDWGCVILREIDFLLKICWSIPCLHPSWKVHTCFKLVADADFISELTWNLSIRSKVTWDISFLTLLTYCKQINQNQRKTMKRAATPNRCGRKSSRELFLLATTRAKVANSR